MRWNETVTLLSAANKYQDSAGAWHEGERVAREVFCNQMTIGTMAMAHLRSSDVRIANTTEPVDVGMHNEKMVQLRTIDYGGEDQVLFHGEEYQVMYSSGAGEFVTLTIAQQLGNANPQEPPSETPNETPVEGEPPEATP